MPGPLCLSVALTFFSRFLKTCPLRLPSWSARGYNRPFTTTTNPLHPPPPPRKVSVINYILFKSWGVTVRPLNYDEEKKTKVSICNSNCRSCQTQRREAEETGAERGGARRSYLKRRDSAIVNQTNIGTISKATLGKLMRQGWSAYGLFRAHTYHLELNSTGHCLRQPSSFEVRVPQNKA